MDGKNPRKASIDAVSIEFCDRVILAGCGKTVFATFEVGIGPMTIKEFFRSALPDWGRSKSFSATCQVISVQQVDVCFQPETAHE
jgi:hypothetical protein